MKRIALCIGNDEYTSLPSLSCAVADATAMYEKLCVLGFETEIKTNLNREKLGEAILSFIEKLGNYDAALIYYAGHGFQIEGDNILAPIELSINQSPACVKFEAFPISDLTEQFNKFPNKTKIIILDACRSNLGTRGSTNGFAPMLAPQGSIIAFATSPGQSSNENINTGHGYYTEALLKYMDLPRIPIETTFKKVREMLFNNTNGTQIPWEHTSLVGEFYFNPDTIYDGVTYSQDAYADSKFHFNIESKVKDIVVGLKSHNWSQQEKAINTINEINFQIVSGNELFILGRNIYQAADGNCFLCQHFIDSFSATKMVPNQAKLHILNGMAYEIYFDSHNEPRKIFKTGFYKKIIEFLENPEFYGSLDFIKEKLNAISDRPLYIPGQNEVMEFVIRTHKEQEGHCIDDILFGRKSVYYDEDGKSKANALEFPVKINKYKLEQDLAKKVVALADRVMVQYDSKIEKNDTLLVPQYGFQIKY